MKKAKAKARAKIKSKASKAKSTSARSADWAVQLVKSVWPQERDFFERPDRYRYVRKLLPETGSCVFCEAVKAGISADSLVLHMDTQVIVVMNKFPYNSGHLLILPREHIGNLWDVSDEVMAAMARWQKRSAKILSEVLKCHGFNLGMNHGAVAGAGIPDHMHWHVVPRWGGDTNFFPLIAETKALPETVQQTYERLVPEFQKGFKDETDF